METLSSRMSYLQQFKRSVYYGLALGCLVGLVLAYRQAYVLDHYAHKGLQLVTLEVFASGLLKATAMAVLTLLVLFPALTVTGEVILGLRNLTAARWAVGVAGLVWVLVGYKLNKSEWYPPLLSPLGLAANSAFTLACLGLMVTLYRTLFSKLALAPDARFAWVKRLYHPAAFGVLALAFVGFQGYVHYRLAQARPIGPNLLFITIDTLRADRLGCYGHPAPTSPTIDRLAGSGTRFEHCYAQRGLTWPSLTSIMTSLYPKTHGVLKNQWPLDGQFITLAEILKEQGYRTGAFLANFYYAPNRGFEVKKGGEVGDLDKTVTRDAMDWLGTLDPKRDRFFMWVHYKNPHDPYTPPADMVSLFDSTYTGPFDGSRSVLDSIYVNRIDLDERDLAYINALYDAEIRTTDGYIDRLLKKLDRMGLTDSTLIVFGADHGEELYEHNYYFFHSCSMYDGVLRIPLIFNWPKVIPQGKVIEHQVESIDIVPTILELLKVPLRPEFEGQSAVPLIFGATNGASRPVFAERAGAIFSIRTPEWKYIYNPDGYHTYCSRSDDDVGAGYLIAAEELYDVRRDRKELNNVVDDHRQVALELRAQILEWLNTNKRQHKEHKLTKEAEERLRALGYIK